MLFLILNNHCLNLWKLRIKNDGGIGNFLPFAG